MKVAKFASMSAMIPLAHHQIALPGEMGDGLVVFARETTKMIGKHPVISLESRLDLPNWAPIIDFQVNTINTNIFYKRYHQYVIKTYVYLNSSNYIIVGCRL